MTRLLLAGLAGLGCVCAAAAGSNDASVNAWVQQAKQYMAEEQQEQPKPMTNAGEPTVNFFLRNMSQLLEGTAVVEGLPAWLDGYSVYRVIPFEWPEEMNFHYDGLASAFRVDFHGNGTINYHQKPYQSNAAKNFEKCLFLGAGTFNVGIEPCLTNPGVNSVPRDGQLWMTIDNRFWGMLEMDTLDTPAPLGIPGIPEVESVTLNAHPACDYNGNGQCLVTYPCAATTTIGLVETFEADHLCVGYLEFGQASRKVDLSVVEMSRAKLPKSRFLIHSHSPAITENFLVNKIDNFGTADKDARDTGMLRFLHQEEGNLWLVMDRRTNESRILESDFGFVNNHFVNPFEAVVDGVPMVVVDAMPGTSNYLENYFRHNLANETWMKSRWEWIMFEPKRCYVPQTGDGPIKCETLLKPSEAIHPIGMDFPQFNPFYKYNADSKWWYVTANSAGDSMWFDTLAKIDSKDRSVAKTFHEEGVYVMEANFLPRNSPDQGGAEDDGILFSIFYNSTDDSSFIALLDPVEMTLLHKVPLPSVVPYHSHGVLCRDHLGSCFANP